MTAPDGRSSGSTPLPGTQTVFISIHLEVTVGDIGKPIRHIELEPVETPATAPSVPTVPAEPVPA